MSVSFLHVSAVLCRDLKLLPLAGILRFLTKAAIYVPVPIALSNGRVSASGAGGRVFESRPRHTKGVKMVPRAILLGAQHYKASTGSPLTHY